VLTVSGLYGVTPQEFIDSALMRVAKARRRGVNIETILIKWGLGLGMTKEKCHEEVIRQFIPAS
jgi:hypothetical protein